MPIRASTAQSSAWAGRTDIWQDTLSTQDVIYSLHSVHCGSTKRSIESGSRAHREEGGHRTLHAVFQRRSWCSVFCIQFIIKENEDLIESGARAYRVGFDCTWRSDQTKLDAQLQWLNWCFVFCIQFISHTHTHTHTQADLTESGSQTHREGFVCMEKGSLTKLDAALQYFNWCFVFCIQFITKQNRWSSFVDVHTCSFREAVRHS